MMRFVIIASALLTTSVEALSSISVKAPTKVVSLNKANIAELQSEGFVECPNYDNSELTPGILQVGVGNFFRSHFCAYVEDVLNTPDLFEENKQWGIVGAGLYSPKKRDRLAPQDWIQTLVERDGTSAKASLLASMIDYLPQNTDDESKKHEALMEKLMDPNIKIVALTITEGGYYLYDGRFNLEDPAIMSDLDNPDSPHTIFGMMIKALKYRKENDILPFTILSCDNIPHNGDVVESIMTGIAEQQCSLDDQLACTNFADYIANEVAFPNSMVDRITPACTEASQEFLKKNFGVDDVSPIFCEPFRQWVLEDKFCNGRPDWDKLDLEKANIIFTDDVSPFELMKIRILNGGHASLCYPAALLDLEFVHDAMEHPLIGPFLDIVEKTEFIPTVPPVPNVDLPDYWQSIEERFSNPTIDDSIGRNTYDGASRQPKFIVPVADDALRNGGKIDGLAMVSAMWCRYCQGTTESGKPVPSRDPIWKRLHANAEKAKTDPNAWLSMRDVYGNVGDAPEFQEAFAKALKIINEEGVEAALKSYIGANKAAASPLPK
mmetsp:Transcript_2723/g.3669  ORF Transcript_2723/g.3669 Transcript_2723/m.3669 type:complete len:550 (-) Transcript_2723:105-1754(-)|eukprot:CAMPEP_0198143482 /NCGR_PEP_ID=MMETSP1443-20131203/7887_1 /TAXON_ID=186043 /ORGANISM="Entomoneis sp., Strain CCMP2396" /LENGTH=549 /DNA_ID=CAMNT_0043806727 /DNA_START=40 /DNA_END=1689 /DNA_ORIENTATION=-